MIVGKFHKSIWAKSWQNQVFGKDYIQIAFRTMIKTQME